MASCKFIKGHPADFFLESESTLFHDPRHLALQSPTGWNSFFCIKDNVAKALIHVNIEKGIAQSPLKGPYGSVVAYNDIDEKELDEFVRIVIDELRRSHVRRIHITGYPQFVLPENSEMVHEVLLNAGFDIIQTEYSAVLYVAENSFQAGLHRSHQKRLKKCKDAGFTAKRLELDQLKAVYKFIVACRNEKAYTLSMSLEAIEELVAVFPDRIALFGVCNEEKLIAASICIRECSDILYDFYHDHSSQYDQYSPVVLLVESMAEYCLHENIGSINLGTSASESLLTFKQRLGAKISPKYSYNLILSND